MAERPLLEAVVFDAGGTLVRLDFEWMAATLSRLGHPLDAAALRRAEVAGRRRYDRSRGHQLAPGELHSPLGSAGDTHCFFTGMLEAAGVRHGLVEAAIAEFLEHHAEGGLWGKPMEGAREAVAAVLALGLRCAVVSNSDGRAERHLAECGVRDGLEFVVDSQVEGVEKPDPEIFRIALRRLGLPAERALYVGDIRSVDEAGARAAGMHFVLIDPYGDYGAPEGPRIASIARLPEWVAAHFTAGAQGRTPVR